MGRESGKAWEQPSKNSLRRAMWGDSLLVERLACFAGLLSTCLITGDIHFSSFFINLFIHLPYKWNKMTSFFHPFFYPLFIHFLQVKQNFVKFSSIFFYPLFIHFIYLNVKSNLCNFSKNESLLLHMAPHTLRGPTYPITIPPSPMPTLPNMSVSKSCSFSSHFWQQH